MQEERARQILEALIDGLNPLTGTELPADSPFQHGPILRALLTAAAALKRSQARQERRAALPPNCGKPWTDTEFAQLVAARREGVSLEDLAVRHGRTVRGIHSRLQLAEHEAALASAPNATPS
jgi:hypothetical protein